MSDTPLFAAGPAQLNGHKVVIIDGHALVFRSYFAFQNLRCVGCVLRTTARQK
jgi:5'-3' exonuclease